MPIPVMQIVGLSVFTACAIIAAGLLFIERPMEGYQSSWQPSPPLDRSTKKKKQEDGVFELISMGFSYSKAVEALQKCGNLESAVEWLLNQEDHSPPNQQTETVVEQQPQKDLITFQEDWITQERQVLQQRLTLLEEYENKTLILKQVSENSDSKEYRKQVEKEVNDIRILLDSTSVHSQATLDSVSMYQSFGMSSVESPRVQSPAMLNESTRVREPTVSMLDIPMVPTLNQTRTTMKKESIQGTEAVVIDETEESLPFASTECIESPTFPLVDTHETFVQEPIEAPVIAIDETPAEESLHSEDNRSETTDSESVKSASISINGESVKSTSISMNGESVKSLLSEERGHKQFETESLGTSLSSEWEMASV